MQTGLLKILSFNIKNTSDVLFGSYDNIFCLMLICFFGKIRISFALLFLNAGIYEVAFWKYVCYHTEYRY